MSNIFNRYDMQLNKIFFAYLEEMYQFINGCGGTIDIPNCRSSLTYAIQDKSGKQDIARGSIPAQSLFTILNDWYGVGIIVEQSGRVGAGFNVYFEACPFDKELLNQEVTENGKTEDEEEETTEDNGDRGQETPEGDDQENQEEAVSSEGSESEGVEGDRETTETVELGDPDFSDMKPPKWSKKKVAEEALKYGIELDTKPKMAKMVEDFESEYNQKVEA